MIGIWHTASQQFLLWLCIVTTLVFALPITFAPLRWATLMRWRLPEDTDLAVYFGRCLGCFILIVEALMLRAALDGTALVTVFEILAAIFASMVALHIVGAIQRIQPWTETVEIGLYSVLFALTLGFYPVVG
ncbi:hypothetical protein [Azoarcus olearius]|uniref:Hypothetical membrane protein n=1 Tax=Azoarcus sp. (strain BH72) TaxID=418699 RepID=A1K5L4_AZOSB|nr:hypothetical protein [Azoarcus olearius]CAL94119.1 hypothetical membrane protein [Azoarcus olearius]